MALGSAASVRRGIAWTRSIAQTCAVALSSGGQFTYAVTLSVSQASSATVRRAVMVTRSIAQAVSASIVGTFFRRAIRAMVITAMYFRSPSVKAKVSKSPSVTDPFAEV